MPGTPLTASFLQPDYRLLPGGQEATHASWHAWLTDLHRCGVRRLVVQFIGQLQMNASAAEATLWPILTDPPPGDAAHAGFHAADALLAAASSLGLQVDIGLLDVTPPREGTAQKPGWDWLSQQADLPALDTWLARLAAEEAAVSQAWHARYGAASGPGTAWGGWYLNLEIDELSWRMPGTRERFLTHLRERCVALRRLDAGRAAGPRPITVGGFAGEGVADPAAAARVVADWDGWAADLPVDEIVFQDGLGAVAGRSPERVRQLLGGVRAAAHRHHRRFTPVVELFRGSGISASPDELEAALALARPFADTPIGELHPQWLCFDVPNAVLGHFAGAARLRDHVMGQTGG